MTKHQLSLLWLGMSLYWLPTGWTPEQRDQGYTGHPREEVALQQRLIVLGYQ
jgi:hypothetical protein